MEHGEITDSERAAEIERLRKERSASPPAGWERFAPIYPGAKLVDRIMVGQQPVREHNPYE
jgi:hypothetical protein